MAVDNLFRMIGVCYGNPVRKLYKLNKYHCYFTLVVDSFKGDKKNFIPMVAAYDVSEKAYALCRNGNEVAVKGEVITTEINNYQTGLIDVRIHFVATDIMLINKVNRKKLDDKKVADLISSMPIDYEERNEK